jgi:putative tryptophan/tyrosine transport system substrate-binding protein
MRRREFIAGLAGAAAWPLAGSAQDAVLPIVGYLNGTSFTENADRVHWFLRGLQETGYDDGRNVVVEWRWADDHYERLPALAADLVRRRVRVIAATGGLPEARAAKAATSEIPIIFQTGVNPVATGLVASLARPGGNITGVTQMSVELMPKLLELLHELAPAATSMALLVNPSNSSTEFALQSSQVAASRLGINLNVAHAKAEHELADVFEALSRQHVGGVAIGADVFLSGQNAQIAALALRHRIPAIYTLRSFPAVGGLMSYGGDIAAAIRLAGVYAGRILNGEKPADLPVQQSTKIEFVLNLKTAKALGLTIPEALLATADEVIQ